MCVYPAVALSLYHGRVRDEVTVVVQVQGVVALGLGGNPVSQFLDCNGTQNNVTNLVWRKDNAETRFSVAARSTGLRLDLTNAQVSDEGVYMCVTLLLETLYQSMLQDVRLYFRICKQKYK